MHGVPFDIVDHHRQRTRRAEARANALEHVRNRLERLLAITLKAAAGQDCDPLVLLTVIERLDQEAQRGRSLDELAQLLRETAPASGSSSSSERPKQEAPAAA